VTRIFQVQIMRTIPPALAASLDAGATNLARCWKLSRVDDVTLGFTDHDRDLAFDGVTYLARTGLEAAEATTELGFAVGGGDVSGALVAASITEDDIAAGMYDGARVEIWIADWANPDARMLLDAGTIGEIARSDVGFVAEVRGPMAALDVTRGRLYRADCAADLGDTRCGVNLDDPAFHCVTSVATTDGRLGLNAPALASFGDGWFTRGKLTWTGGANVGARVEVKVHRAEGGALVLWQPAARPIAPGDTFRVEAGCDKRFPTCRAKFANVVNFRGFPHMPGNDFVVSYPTGSEPNLDGGSLFK
jgi:uncharacterized phage protein (TIGR02218 family)